MVIEMKPKQKTQEELEEIVRRCGKKIFDAPVVVVMCLSCYNPIDLETYKPYELNQQDQNYLRRKYSFTFSTCKDCAE